MVTRCWAKSEHGQSSDGERESDPETLIKIGHAAGKTPREMFILAGWLEEEPTELTAEEETLLADYRRLRDEPALRAVGLGVFRTILEQLRNQGQNPESV